MLRLDATSLRVLAHPLRARLLSALRIDGAATATELAARLDTNTGATSYHLRKLESVGLVRDTGEGTGKRRVWESATRGHEWDPSEFAGDPDSEASLAWLTGFYRTFHDERATQWAQHATDWPGPLARRPRLRRRRGAGHCVPGPRAARGDRGGHPPLPRRRRR